MGSVSDTKRLVQRNCDLVCRVKRSTDSVTATEKHRDRRKTPAKCDRRCDRISTRPTYFAGLLSVPRRSPRWLLCGQRHGPRSRCVLTNQAYLRRSSFARLHDPGRRRATVHGLRRLSRVCEGSNDEMVIAKSLAYRSRREMALPRPWPGSLSGRVQDAGAKSRVVFG